MTDDKHTDDLSDRSIQLVTYTIGPDGVTREVTETGAYLPPHIDLADLDAPDDDGREEIDQ